MSDGKEFPAGTVHVQEYRIERFKDPKTGKWRDQFTRNSKNARLMTDAEIEKYGPIIRHFNSDVKFR